jgi:hypothetical protein
MASQVLVPTVQLNGPAAQAEGDVQVAFVAAPHTPLVHEKLAEPVVGAVLSITEIAMPEAVDFAAASHVLPPTDQVTVPALQAGAVGIVLPQYFASR